MRSIIYTFDTNNLVHNFDHELESRSFEMKSDQNQEEEK
jgi:hypothetical protein